LLNRGSLIYLKEKTPFLPNDFVLIHNIANIELQKSIADV